MLNTINPTSEQTLPETKGDAVGDGGQSDVSPTNMQAFDPNRFLSEDFLSILNEHRKNCEREGKLD